MKKNTLRAVLCLVPLVLSINCATSLNSHLQSAQFALDNNDYETAINEATDALSADPNSVSASHVLASAYFGRSGLNFLDIATGVIDLQNSSDTNFSQIAGILPEDVSPLPDLRSAIETLEAIPGIDGTNFDGELADASFDLGMMQIIEHFAIGVYDANYFTSLDASLITDDDKTIVLNDLLNFDNHLVNAGADSTEDFINEARQTFCMLVPQTTDSVTGEGFTTAEFQDLVGCELTSDSTTYVTTSVVDCSVYDPDSQTQDVQDCYSTDTSL